MAMQSSGKHGVIQSSIALLQERFKQLQREKEMRERRQLLKNTTILSSSSPSPSSSSDSEIGNYYFSSHSNDHFKLLFADEVAVVSQQEEKSPPLHHHRHHSVSLSLWPGGSEIEGGGGRGESIAPILKGLARGEECKVYSSYGCLGLDVKCDESNVCDVDTSLHL